MSRVGLAFRYFFRVLMGKGVDHLTMNAPKSTLPAPQDTATQESPNHTVELLGLLQREGRLIDFLRESIEPYDDAQIGAAVRNIHRDCAKVLDEHLILEPIMTADEDAPIDVPVGFDPQSIRLTGNVTGDPPFRGLLRHRGWLVKQVNLPNQHSDKVSIVLSPAEVELR